MKFRVYRYIRDEHEPREPRLYMRGVGFVCEYDDKYMTEGHHHHRVMSAAPDEHGGIVQLECVIGLATITTTAVCNPKDIFRYKDGDSLCGHTLCLARMQQITDSLDLTDDIDWPGGWPVEPEHRDFLLDWRLYEETQRELKQAAAEERRRNDHTKYALVRYEAAERARIKKLKGAVDQANTATGHWATRA